jgi:hypothetical protein
VFHLTQDVATLRELVHDYLNLVDDATRTKLRIKALFRARGIRTAGRSVFRRDERVHWIEQLSSAGARIRANHLLAELDTITSHGRDSLAARAGLGSEEEANRWTWAGGSTIRGN